MPIISMFYGVIIRMFHFDNAKHRAPHIHVQYGEQHVVIGIPTGKVLEGKMKPAKLKLVQAWIEIHRDDLMADWKLAVEGQKVFRIEPLRQPMIPKITDVKPKAGHKLFVRFKGRGGRVFDMSPYLKKGIFKELQNNKYFQKVRIVWGGVEWPHEQDLSVETLYSLSKPLRGSHKRIHRTHARGQRR